MATGVTDGSRRRSSRRRSNRRSFNILRRPGADRAIFIAMLILAGLYLLITAAELRRAWLSYDLVQLEMLKAEVRYGYDRPNLVRQSSAEAWQPVAAATRVEDYGQWAYNLTSGGRLSVAFDQAGRVASVSCFEPSQQRYACPPQLRIRLGEDETVIAKWLGYPSRSQISGSTKTMWYDDIGLELQLSRFRVYRITSHAEQSGFGAKLFRYIRMLVP